MDQLKEYYVTTHQQVEKPMLSFGLIEPLLNNKKTLDVGCANGKFLERCGPDSLGLDISPLNIKDCLDRGLHVKEADLNEGLPVEDESVDVVLAANILEHLASPIHALQDYNRVLKPDGSLIIFVPIEGTLVNLRDHYYKNHVGHIYSFSIKNMNRLLQLTGFSVETYRFEVPLLRKMGLGLRFLSVLHNLPRFMLYRVSRGYWTIAGKSGL